MLETERGRRQRERVEEREGREEKTVTSRKCRELEIKVRKGGRGKQREEKKGTEEKRKSEIKCRQPEMKGGKGEKEGEE